MSDERHDPKLSAHEDQWLDRVLSEAAPVEPSAALRRAVAEIPLRHPRAEGAGARGSWLDWPSFAMRYALAAALVVLAVGAWFGYEANVLPEVVLIDEEAQPSADDDWEELAQLAFADQLDEELAP